MHAMEHSSILPFQGNKPRIAQDVLVCSGARLIGDVTIGAASSIWFNVVIRGDLHYVKIGERTNIQDNSTLHIAEGEAPCIVGSDVTVGHGAIVHACTVEDLCLIGMGAVILDKAVIRQGSLVAAGALVTQGKEFPPNSLIMGAPAKAVRTLTSEERRGLVESAKHYVETARKFMN